MDGARRVGVVVQIHGKEASVAERAVPVGIAVVFSARRPESFEVQGLIT